MTSSWSTSHTLHYAEDDEDAALERRHSAEIASSIHTEGMTPRSRRQASEDKDVMRAALLDGQVLTVTLTLTSYRTLTLTLTLTRCASRRTAGGQTAGSTSGTITSSSLSSSHTLRTRTLVGDASWCCSTRSRLPD